MQRSLPLLSVFIILIISLLSWSCTKIDATNLGGDLIPAVDNVHTFADTLAITGTQGVFGDPDSNKVYNTDYHVLGNVANDPTFGSTDAQLFLQLKPGFYPFYFGNAGDTISDYPGTQIDSVVMCLAFKSYYGDTNAVQNFSVYQLDNSTNNFMSSLLSKYIDSAYRLNYEPNSTAGEKLLGTAAVYPLRLKDTVFFPGASKATVNNQIRIKLTDPAFISMLTSLNNRDTSTVTNPNGIFRSDSIFLDRLKGFRIKSDGGGKGLFYVSLTDEATRLEFHYKYRNRNKLDTSFTSFYFQTGSSVPVAASAHANSIKRDRSSSTFGTQPDALYIQTTPGTYANLAIPQLSNLSNRIIHRAEIFVEQIPTTDPSEKYLLPPAYLYLDLIDTPSSVSKFKPLYIDLNPSSTYNPDDVYPYFYPYSAGIDFSYYGGYASLKNDGAGNSFYGYSFNISRYVQSLVTNHNYNYQFRLYAPHNLYYQGRDILYKNNLADGGVKIGNGNNSTRHRMFLRIVYSKI